MNYSASPVPNVRSRSQTLQICQDHASLDGQ